MHRCLRKLTTTFLFKINDKLSGKAWARTSSIVLMCFAEWSLRFVPEKCTHHKIWNSMMYGTCMYMNMYLYMYTYSAICIFSYLINSGHAVRHYAQHSSTGIQLLLVKGYFHTNSTKQKQNKIWHHNDVIVCLHSGLTRFVMVLVSAITSAMHFTPSVCKLLCDKSKDFT